MEKLKVDIIGTRPRLLVVGMGKGRTTFQSHICTHARTDYTLNQVFWKILVKRA